MLRRKIKEVGQVGSARVGAVYVFVCMAREGLSRRWHHKHTYVWGRGMKAQQGPWNNIISVILPGSDSQPTVCLDPWIVLNVYFRQVWETLYIAAQPQKSCRCMSVKAGLIQSSKYVLGGAESWAVENFSFSQTMYKLQIKTKQWERIDQGLPRFCVDKYLFPHLFSMCSLSLFLPFPTQQHPDQRKWRLKQFTDDCRTGCLRIWTTES